MPDRDALIRAARFVHMPSNDVQRVLRGVVLVLQAAARAKIPEAASYVERARHHVADVAGKLPRALPSILAARAPAHDVSDHEVVVAEADAGDGVAASAQGAPHAAPAAASVDSTSASPWHAAPHETAAQVAPAAPSTPAHASPPPDGGAQAPHAATPVASILTDPVTAAIAAAAADTAADTVAVGGPRAREFRERRVPASPLARLVGFGGLAASLAVGAASEAIGGALRGGSTAASAAAGTGGAPRPAFVSAAQAEVLAEGLCRMRGAALKVGQMLSLADESVLPPAVAAALERVRTQADVMPKRQLHAVLAEELGPEWHARLGGPGGFGDAPVAAASIGQVHRAVLPDGRPVAVKVQYPGVARSIGSDLDNLRALLNWASFLPRGLYLDAIIDVAREELSAECDYVREADAQEAFRALVGDDPDFTVPAVVRELSTARVLVSDWVPGATIDAVAAVGGAGGGPGGGAPQAVKDAIARKLLRLTLNELFVWRFMQTDPNWGNFLYDAPSGRIGLLDFGAARAFPKPFVDEYLRLVWAAANGDRATVADVSVRLGFLTGLESRAMLDAHVDSAMIVGEPFAARGRFDFRAAGITARVSRYGAVFAEQRLTPPPREVYSLHRKLAGAFLICIRMGAVMECRDLLEELHAGYVWGDGDGDGDAPAVAGTPP